MFREQLTIVDGCNAPRILALRNRQLVLCLIGWTTTLGPRAEGDRRIG